jgi:hypothetical protein
VKREEEEEDEQKKKKAIAPNNSLRYVSVEREIREKPKGGSFASFIFSRGKKKKITQGR